MYLYEGGLMQLDIINIGNSKGLRLPKGILKQCGIGQTVNVKVQDHTLIITPCTSLRKNWEQAFQKMSANSEDILIDEHTVTSWDETEWQW